MSLIRHQAEDAAQFYAGIFKNSKITGHRPLRRGGSGDSPKATGLSAGAEKNSQQCGWLKDQFGVSWQIVPTILPELLGGTDHEGAQRTMKAMLPMKKLDIAKLQQAYAG